MAPPWSPLLAFLHLPLRKGKTLLMSIVTYDSNLNLKKKYDRKGSKLKKVLLGQRISSVLTGRSAFEVVVVLGDIGKNAQPVWDP